MPIYDSSVGSLQSAAFTAYDEIRTQSSTLYKRLCTDIAAQYLCLIDTVRSLAAPAHPVRPQFAPKVKRNFGF